MSEDKLFETPDVYCLYWKYCDDHACYCPLGGHTEIDPEILKKMMTWTDEQQKELEELDRKLAYYDMLDKIEKEKYEILNELEDDDFDSE